MKLEIRTHGVGQGLCNTVALMGDEGEVFFLALLDCGSGITNFRKWASVSNFHYEKIKELVWARFQQNQLFFDVLAVSHQDADHWNLITDLIARLLQDSGYDTTYSDESGVREGMEFGIDSDSLLVYGIDHDTRYYYHLDSESAQYEWELCDEQITVNIEVMYEGKDCRVTAQWTRGVPLLLGDFECEIQEENSQIIYEINARTEEGAGQWHLLVTNLSADQETVEDGDGEIPEGCTIGSFFEITVRRVLARHVSYASLITFAASQIKAMETYDEEYIQDKLEHCQKPSPACPKCIGNVFLFGEKRKRGYTSFENRILKYSYEGSLDLANGIDILMTDFKLKLLFQTDSGSALAWQRGKTGSQSLSDTVIRNLSSAVIEIVEEGEAPDDVVIFPGDATVHTMALLNEEMADRHYLLMVAPHHGSQDSSSYKQDGVNQYDVLDEFLRKTGPLRIHISSGAGNRYKHPGAVFVDKAKTVTYSVPTHNVYVHRGGKLALEPASTAIFTTVMISETAKTTQVFGRQLNSSLPPESGSGKSTAQDSRPHSREIPPLSLFQ